MKLLIHLTETMATNLLAVCSKERRFPRQQAELLLEKALETALSNSDAEFCGIDARQKGDKEEASYSPAAVS